MTSMMIFMFSMLSGHHFCTWNLEMSSILGVKNPPKQGLFQSKQGSFGSFRPNKWRFLQRKKFQALRPWNGIWLEWPAKPCGLQRAWEKPKVCWFFHIFPSSTTTTTTTTTTTATTLFLGQWSSNTLKCLRRCNLRGANLIDDSNSWSK